MGDILVGINGQPVPDHDALFAHLIGEMVGKSIPIEVLRGGQPQTFMVEIGARP
jgi:serine protease DegQ